MAQMHEKYRNVPGRIAAAGTTSPSARVKKNLAPLPRYSAALRNIRRFDDEVSRVLAEGKRVNADEKENDRWNRMQKRRRVEQMIRDASTPKFGRHPNDIDENDNKNGGKVRKYNNANRANGDEEDDDKEDIETYRKHQHHSRPRSLALKHLGVTSNNSAAHQRTNKNYSKNEADGGIYDDDDGEEDESDRQQQNREQDDEEDDDDDVGRIPGWVSYCISRFQANCIGWVVRRKLERARDSVIKIQRAFRDHLANRGVNLALRILQKAGRAMKVRRRLHLLSGRHRVWKQASEEHKLITTLCLRLHSATAFAAKLPVLEAANREKIEEEHHRSFEDHHFELTGSELRRRALLTCVAPKGKLRRESFRRLLDNDDEEPAGDRAQKLKPIETPHALIPVMKEIEEDEPSPRRASESPRVRLHVADHDHDDHGKIGNKSTNNNDGKNNHHNVVIVTSSLSSPSSLSTSSPIRKEELLVVAEQLKLQKDEDEQERRVEEEHDRREEEIVVVASSSAVDTTIVPVNEVEEL